MAGVISSNSWFSVRSFVLSTVSTISIALIYYRIFGNGSPAFLTNWLIFQFVGFILIFIVIWFISKKSFSKFRDSMVILGY